MYFLIEVIQDANEEIPENHNIRKNVHRDKFNGSEWESKDYKEVCKELFRNIGKDLVDFLNTKTDIHMFSEFSEENKKLLLELLWIRDWYGTEYCTMLCIVFNSRYRNFKKIQR